MVMNGYSVFGKRLKVELKKGDEGADPNAAAVMMTAHGQMPARGPTSSPTQMSPGGGMNF